MKKINYQVMDDSQLLNKGGLFPGDYSEFLPDYDTLILNSSCKEEAYAWLECKEQKLTFAFNTVYAVQQSCGHWEVFQTATNEEYNPLEKALNQAAEIALNRKCTRCICGW